MVVANAPYRVRRRRRGGDDGLALCYFWVGVVQKGKLRLKKKVFLEEKVIADWDRPWALGKEDRK